MLKNTPWGSGSRHVRSKFRICARGRDKILPKNVNVRQKDVKFRLKCVNFHQHPAKRDKIHHETIRPRRVSMFISTLGLRRLVQDPVDLALDPRVVRFYIAIPP